MSRRDRDSDYVDVRFRERSRERVSQDSLARYFEGDRRAETGAMVLSQRDVEILDRARPRQLPSPSSAHVQKYYRARAESSPSPSPPRNRDRDRERDHIHIDVERSHSIASSSPSPAPSPPPPPQVIQTPIVERQVITHYTDVNHGTVYVQPPPRPEPPRERQRDTEVDVYTSRHRADVEITESSRARRRRSPSREHLRAPASGRASDVHLNVEVDVNDSHRTHRRARSAQPPRMDRRFDPVAEEARAIETRIDGRGRIGEAYNGATRQWSIIDVPPGTERIRMDGVGGGGAEVTWQRYNGVRRTRFIPERDGELVVPGAPPPASSRDVLVVRDRPRHRSRSHGGQDHLAVQVVDKHRRGGSRGREVDVDIDVETLRREPPAPPPRDDPWTEITKDLVSREALEYIGYNYIEEDYFFHILQYMRSEDVEELVDLTDRLRRQRNRHKERRSRDELDIDVDVRRRSHSHHRPRRDDRRGYEQVVIDKGYPVYYR